MTEEFITDIIGDVETPNTKAEMVAETKETIEEPTAQPNKSVSDNKARMGSEATPDTIQNELSNTVNKAVAGDESDTVKEIAAQLGWREDHKGEDSVDAKTYILKSKDIQKSMSQHNKDLKDQLQVLNSSVDALKQHNESVYQAEVKKLTIEVNELKKERRDAIELADVEKVEKLDKQIDEKQKDINAPKPVDDQQSTNNPIYDEWIKDNEWYITDGEMANFADTVAEQYAGAPPERVYALVRNKVQEVFPDKFSSPDVITTKDVPAEVKSPVGPKSPVERSSTKVTDGAFNKADLSADQLQIMNQFVRGGIMTEEQYINDIAKMQ